MPARDVGASVIGIDPRREARVSELPKQMRQGTLAALYGATNAIILGDRLAEKIGARIGANLTDADERGAASTHRSSAFFHSGVRQIDESTAYVLVRTGQILAKQTGLFNELRVRTDDPLAAHEVAAGSRATPATSRSPGRRRTRT